MALNGQFPDTLLTYLGWPEADHLRLTPDAATSLNRLAVAFEEHFGKPLYLSDAYRTLAEQKRLKITKGAFAAQPGTSNHGWGLAIDMASRINVDSSDEHKWMEDNGPYYGWINPWWATDRIRTNGEYEPWHWEYHFALDRSSDEPKPTPIKLTPTQQETEPMLILGNKDSHLVAIIYPTGRWALIQEAADATALRAAGVPTADVSSVTWGRMCPPVMRMHTL